MRGCAVPGRCIAVVVRGAGLVELPVAARFTSSTPWLSASPWLPPSPLGVASVDERQRRSWLLSSPLLPLLLLGLLDLVAAALDWSEERDG